MVSSSPSSCSACTDVNAPESTLCRLKVTETMLISRLVSDAHLCSIRGTVGSDADADDADADGGVADDEEEDDELSSKN